MEGSKIRTAMPPGRVGGDIAAEPRRGKGKFSSTTGLAALYYATVEAL
jgi:hypothetical protein